MAEIIAFLAYSYSDNDKELNGIFIEHLSTLSKSIPGFTWDHAKWAEPEPVSNKVLARFEGKNVLICICTKNEYAVSPNSVFHTPFLNFANLKPPGAQWKTSDWIIQEVGLAIGRGMKVILLLENGVRSPGGLFGDVECIPFSRENPQASFTKLQQMLSAPPKELGVQAVAESIPTTSNKASEAEEPTEDWEPRPDWDQSRYNRAAFRAIVVNRDADAFAAVDSAYRKSPLAKEIALTTWEVRTEFLRMILGQRSDLEKIKQAARDNPTNGVLLYYLACGYREFGQLESAARTFEDAAANTEDDEDKLQYLANAALHYAQTGQWGRSREITETLKRSAGDASALQYALLTNLLDLASAEKDKQLELAILEEMVELRPSDSSTRFNLAYKHSDAGNSDMALYHYLKIPVFERTAVTWNNLGVAYSAFHMPILAVNAFRASEEQNNSLAMCNLGFRLLGSGFATEAQAEAEKALAIKPHHQNVSELLKRLNEASEEEKNKVDETLQRTNEKAAFYRKLGKSVLRSTPSVVAPNWKSEDGLLEAQMDGTSIKIRGTRQRHTLGGLGAGMFGSNVTLTEQIEYSGQLRGCAIFGQVKRTTEGQTPSLLDSSADAKTVMLFNEDHTEISVMERPDSLYPSFYSFRQPR